MEKQDSLASVAVKSPPSEYPDNESYTTEPPPAYRQPRSTAVQVAKIVCITVVVASTILGACILASAWIQARATCELMMMERQLQEAEMRAEERPSFQALVQDGTNNEETTVTAPSSTTPASNEQINSDENDVEKVKLPLQLVFDDLTGPMEKNQRAHMNCVVEKRRSEELVDHAPRAVRLPFGLNLTTPPRLEHVTGERMVISCESGQDHQRQMPMIMPMPFAAFHQQAQAQHAPEVAMIVEHHHPPVPLSAMVPPPVPQQPEARGFQAVPMPIQIRDALMEEDQQRDESADHHEARLLPGIPIQIRQIHEEPPQHLRPHFVQPRSVPSNPDFLGKRVKRCACNCDC